MAFCPSCGASVEGRFCAKCGTSIHAGMQAGGPQAPPPPAPAGSGLTDNVAGALCYVAGLITGIVFLVLAPYNQNKFIRFHAFQSIFFNVLWIAIWIADLIVGVLLHSIFPFGVGLLMALVGLVIWLGGFLLWLFLMYKAYSNEKFMLPIIGPIADKQA
jgi:uncharacterized membrane protein